MSKPKTNENGTVSPMPSDQFARTRTDTRHIGSSIKKLVDLMLAGKTLRAAAQELGISQRVAERALQKPHVRHFARTQKLKVLEELSMNVPNRLHDLMMKDDNQNAAVRAATALHDLATGEQERRRQALANIGQPTPGLTIQIMHDSPTPLTINNPATPQAAPVTIEHRHAPQLIKQNAADDE
jgi:hypothetical protein